MAADLQGCDFGANKALIASFISQSVNYFAFHNNWPELKCPVVPSPRGHAWPYWRPTYLIWLGQLFGSSQHHLQSREAVVNPLAVFFAQLDENIGGNILAACVGL